MIQANCRARRLAADAALAVSISTLVAACDGSVVADRRIQASVTSGVELRSEPARSAPALVYLSAGDAVYVLRRVGAWREVDAAGRRGFIHAQHLRTKAGAPSRTPPSQPSAINPTHLAVLERAGWADYVLEHIDSVEYLPVRAIRHTPRGMVTGQATVVAGRRVAQVATDGYSSVEIASVLVHEAAHLQGVAATGTMYSDEYAYEVQARFDLAVGRFR